MFIDERLKLFKESKVVNWHEHVWFDQNKNLNVPNMERLMGHAELLGIDTTVVSLPLTGGYNKPEDVERVNPSGSVPLSTEYLIDPLVALVERPVT